jgi:hypothetical protein
VGEGVVRGDPVVLSDAESVRAELVVIKTVVVRPAVSENCSELDGTELVDGEPDTVLENDSKLVTDGDIDAETEASPDRDPDADTEALVQKLANAVEEGASSVPVLLIDAELVTRSGDGV